MEYPSLDKKNTNIPKCHEEDITRTKTYKKNNPVQPTE